MGRRRIKVTICNVPIQLNEEVLAAFLTILGDIENIEKCKSANGTAHGDYIFTMCLDRGGFTAIPHVLEYENQVMTVVVEGRKPQCWNCKQLGHFSKSCPQKTTKTTPSTTTTATETTTTATIAATAAVAAAVTSAGKNETPKAKTGDSPDKEDGWTQVVKGGEEDSYQRINHHKTNKYFDCKHIDTIATTTTNTATAKSSSSSTAKSSSSSSSTKKKSKEKHTEKENEAMDCSNNLKRWRDSGGSVAGEGEKKHIKGPTQETQTQSKTPSQPQEKGENIERPAQIIPPPQKPQNTPAHFSEFPLSLKSPSLSPIKTPRQLVRSHSFTRESPTKEAATSSSPSTHQKPRSLSASNEARRAFTAYHYSQDILEPQHMDHVLKKHWNLYHP